MMYEAIVLEGDKLNREKSRLKAENAGINMSKERENQIAEIDRRLNILERKRVRVDGGKLSFSSDAFQLNKKKKLVTIHSRKIFKGYYEDDIEVAIQKIMLSSESLLKEIEREFQILRQLNNHENFIRYYTYETEKVERADFV